jgi:hypothetical protein
MSYTIQPVTPSTPYWPLVFRNSRTTTADAESLLVEVYVGGTLAGSYRKPYDTVSTAGVYTFDCDAQIPVSRECGPQATAMSTLFGTMGEMNVVTNSDIYKAYTVATYLETLNNDGYLETSTASGETSSILYALPAARRKDTVNLGRYHYPTNGSGFEFLTAAPDNQPVADTDNYFLSFLSNGTNAVRFIFYEYEEGRTKEVVISLVEKDDIEFMVTIGVGPANILGTVNASILSGTMPTSLAAYRYYEVSAGVYATGTYTRRSEIRNLVLDGTCTGNLRLYWMNPYAGIDQYTFFGQLLRKQQDTGVTTEIAPAWNIATTPQTQPYSRGNIKTAMTAATVFEVREPVDFEKGEFLRTIRKSPEVYASVNGEYHAVVIAPGEVEYDNNRTAQTVMTFNVLMDSENIQDI